MFVLSSFFYSGKCYAQTEPTSSDWVSFVFTCMDKPNDPYYDVVFPGGTFMNFDYNGFHEGIDFDPTPGPNWDISPSGDLMAFPNFFTDYRDFGYVDFVGQDGDGNDVNARVYFVECCDNNLPTVDFILAEPSRLSFWNPTGAFSSDNVLVLGNVEIDIQMSSSESQFKMGTDASLNLIGSTELLSDEDHFFPYCKIRWDAIRGNAATNNQRIILEKSKYEGAIRGLFGQNNVDLQMINSISDNNIIGVLIENFTAGGPHQPTSSIGSYFKLDESMILNTVDVANTPVHPSSPIDLTPYVSNLSISTSLIACSSSVGIMLFNSTYVEVGSVNYNKNEFFVSPNPTDNYIHLASDNSHFTFENNDVDFYIGIEAHSSSGRIGGTSIGHRNYFNFADIIFYGGNPEIRRNHIYHTKVELNNPNPTAFTNFEDGAFFEENYLANVLVSIENSALNAVKVHVKNNISEGSSYRFENIDDNPSLEYRLVVNNNEILNLFAEGSMVVTNCNNPVFGDNNFRIVNSLVIQNNDLIQAFGLKLINCNNPEIISNRFEPFLLTTGLAPGFKQALYLEGNIDILTLNCNNFTNAFYCVQFGRPSTSTSAHLTDDIGSTGPGVGANNSFLVQQGFTGFNTTSGLVMPQAALFGEITTPGGVNIDYHFYDNSILHPDFEPLNYGVNGIVFPNNPIIDQVASINNSGCLSTPQKRTPLTDVKDRSEDKNELVVYPNPANQSMNIDFPQDLEIADFYITNLLGRILVQENQPQKSITLSLPQGQYILIARATNGTTFTKKIIFIN
jgi:hypothetical protein